jgi:hypothetical protein
MEPAAPLRPDRDTKTGSFAPLLLKGFRPANFVLAFFSLMAYSLALLEKNVNREICNSPLGLNLTHNDFRTMPVRAGRQAGRQKISGTLWRRRPDEKSNANAIKQ